MERIYVSDSGASGWSMMYCYCHSKIHTVHMQTVHRNCSKVTHDAPFSIRYPHTHMMLSFPSGILTHTWCSPFHQVSSHTHDAPLSIRYPHTHMMLSFPSGMLTHTWCSPFHQVSSYTHDAPLSIRYPHTWKQNLLQHMFMWFFPCFGAYNTHLSYIRLIVRKTCIS